MSNSILLFPETRVLGVLIEKSKTTPDYYPMTLNGITTACNQKSSRNPVTDFDESTVNEALQSLKQKGLVATEIGGGSRTVKYRHCFRAVYQVSEAQLAVLCLLFLRGPLTAGEINSMSGRLYEFENLQEVLSTLEELKIGDTYITEMPKQSGQKENRFKQLIGEIPEELLAEKSVLVIEGKSNLEARVESLENELEKLKTILNDLIKELKG